MVESAMDHASQALHATAKKTADAAAKALDWLETPKNAERLGDDVDELRRNLHLGVKSAERLAEAARRPMAVAVFGASQAGKSHLIHTLSRKNGKLLARFDGIEPVNYITRINPEKQDRESTGLVTRFSLKGEPTPPGYPVHLRLLEHADVIKIIANAYFFDGEPAKYEQVPEREQIHAHIERFRAAARAPVRNGLDAASVWDIEAYARTNLSHFELVKKLQTSSFWDVGAKIAGSLSIAELAQYFSILWGGHAALSQLYQQLVEALQRLDFAPDAYVPFASIDLDETGVTSILDVDSLKKLASGDPNMIELRTAAGVQASFPRAVAMAITAELHIQMVESPWPFFQHTDLLDFPGYRVRGVPTSETNIDDEQSKASLGYKLEHAPAETIAALVLRGKVEYLFQRYVAEQEITAMLLCVREGNFETPSLPQAIGRWIGTAHGAEAADRSGKDTLLFFVLTRFDKHFVDEPSDRLAENMRGRIETSLVKPFGAAADSWVKNWANGRPFRNLFLMRKPGVSKQSPIYVVDGEYDAGLRETGLQPGSEALIDRMKRSFLTLSEVADHFAEPDRAFDELMKVDDGGSSYLAEKLAPVCRPEIKPNQVRMNLARLRDDMWRRLSPAYHASDVNARLAQRMDVADRIIGDLANCEAAGRLGTLIHGLMVDAGMMSDFLYRGEDTDDSEEAAAAATPTETGRRITLPGAREPRATVPQTDAARSPYHRMAQLALKSWFGLLHDQSRNQAFSEEVRVSPENLDELVSEMIQAARRTRLADRVAETIKAHGHDSERRDLKREKAALIATRLINHFVYDFGFDQLPEDQRPHVPTPESEEGRVAFARSAVTYDASGIAAEPAPYKVTLAEDWIHGLYRCVENNAKSVDGVDIDFVQNDRLGAILAELTTGSNQGASDEH